MVNTLDIFEILKDAQIEEPKARAIVKAIEKADEKTREDMAKVLASKEDILRLENRLLDRIEGSRTDLMKWMVTLLLGGITVILGAMYFMFSFFSRP